MGIEAAVLGPLLGATVSAAGSFITQSANASAQSSINKKTMQFNREEAQKARDFSAQQAVIDRQFNSAQAAAQRQFAAEQGAIGRTYDAQQALLAREFEERMSSSAHQREVNDLRLAGLNPILSATGGSGASTPVAPVVGAPAVSGASASHTGSGTSQASVSGLNAYMKQDIMSKFVSSALEGIRVNNDYLRAKAADKQADAAKKNADTNEYSARWDAYIKNEGLGISKQKAAAEIDKLEADIELMFERLEIEKNVANATIEEKLAAAEKFKSGVLVDNQQASLLQLNKEDLEGRLKYGNLLMQYLPRGLRNEVMNHFVEYIKDNKDAIYDFADSLKAKDFKSVDIPQIETSGNAIVEWLKSKGFIPTVTKLSWSEATRNLIGGK